MQQASLEREFSASCRRKWRKSGTRISGDSRRTPEIGGYGGYVFTGIGVLCLWNPAGEVQRGQLIVATSVAEDVLFAFRAAYEGQFPIERMVLIDEYDGSDALSMKDNNTSAYNCRTVAGSKKWSQHSYGMAIDINPRWNPWVKSGRFDPKDGSAWKDREDVRPGMMVQGGVLIDAFSNRGWGWGGRWASLKDYMHVSANGL
jgi:hypothetical protein